MTRNSRPQGRAGAAAVAMTQSILGGLFLRHNLLIFLDSSFLPIYRGDIDRTNLVPCMSSSIATKVSLRHLRCFVEVANAGSFTVASSKLFVTQSSLTATIQQFEETVGLKLFDRTTRRVVLTPEAVWFKDEAERLLKEFDGAISDLEAWAQSRMGRIRIAAAASVIYNFLVEAIEDFRKAYPGVSIVMRDAGAQMVEQMVLDGEVDFAIASKLTGSDELDYVPLFGDRYGVVCHPDYILAESSVPLRWEDLKPQDFVALTEDTGIGRYLRQHAAQFAIFSENQDEVSSSTSLYAVLSSGNRYSVLPALAANLGNFTNLCYRELVEPTLSREVCLITRRNRSLSPSSRRILDALLGVIQSRSLPAGVVVSERSLITVPK